MQVIYGVKMSLSINFELGILDETHKGCGRAYPTHVMVLSSPTDADR